eukprot:2321473-Prymnesium_polylepis.2
MAGFSSMVSGDAPGTTRATMHSMFVCRSGGRVARLPIESAAGEADHPAIIASIFSLGDDQRAL